MQQQRDHRHLGEALDLFHFQPEAPGAVFWHPRGYRLFRSLEAQVRRWAERDGFREVRTPQVLAQSLWEQSGHWQKNRPKFFQIPGEPPLALKPVSCPGHIQLVKRMNPTADDLPIRLGEFGICHEADPGGAPDGLLRLVQFTVDDGHLFCREDQLQDQVLLFSRSLCAFYRAVGFAELEVALATRPASRFGDEAMWDRAEAMLRQAAQGADLEVALAEGHGAFYGPKLDFTLKDSRGRAWMCGTLQVDFALPQRFDLTYRSQGQTPKPMLMLHRAMLGSLERFLGLVLEELGPALPPWLAPDQAVLAVGSERARAFAKVVLSRMQDAGLRGVLDERPVPESFKRAEAEDLGVPWFLPLGDAEAASGTLRIQGWGGTAALDLAAGMAWMAEHAAFPAPMASRSDGHRA